MNNIDALLDGETSNKVTLTVIEPTRSMSYNGQILLGVEGDHKAERIYFKAPRYIFMDEDVDLCSENIKIYIKFQNATNNTYIYECADKTTSDITGAVQVTDDGDGNVSIDIAGGANASDNGDGDISLAAEEGTTEEGTTEEVVEDEYVYFSWVLTKTVAESAGKVSFIVCVQNIGTNENGAEVIKNEWHSTPFTGEVQKGIPVDSATPEIITDPQTSIYQLKLEIQSVDLIVKQHDDTIKALSEAVNNKADKTELDVKANQTDLEALTKTVNAKADQTDLDALEGTINAKADQTDLDDLEGTINAKADQSDLNSLESRVTNLENNGGSGSGSGDNTELENRVTEVETEIDNIKGDIKTLETVVNSKASQNDVDTLETDVTVLKGRVDTLEAGGSTGEGEDNPVLLERLAVAETDIGNLKNSVNKKADTTTVEDLEGTVNDLQTTKASQSELDALKTTKADQSELDALKTRVKVLENGSGGNVLEIGDFDFPATHVFEFSELPDTELDAANTVMIRTSGADIYLHKVSAEPGRTYVYTACEYPIIYSCSFNVDDQSEMVLSIYDINFASRISTLETKVENIDVSDLESRIEDLESEHTISFTLHDVNGNNQDVKLSVPFRTQWGSLAASNPQIMIDEDGLMCYGSTSRPLFKDSNWTEYVFETDYVEKNKVYYYAASSHAGGSGN